MPARSIAIVGGGFGGVGAAAMLHRAGYRDVTVFERRERIGGVWAANTYPGAACDVPSHLYEFSFAPNPRWSRRYAPQAEIQAYIEDIGRRHDVRVRTGTEVTAARWDGARWRLETSAGPHEADVLIAGCGQLSNPKMPPLPGLDRFAGPAFHTARWRHDVDLAGRRVAVVGTGCSAIQVVPAIQPVVEHLDVYQRSPGWTLPRTDFAYKERTLRLLERFPLLQRLEREAIIAVYEFGALAMTSQRRLLALGRAAGRMQINRAIEDPELRRKVTPTDEIGCKRIMITDDWYPALAKPNVDLVTDRIAEIRGAWHPRRGRHDSPGRRARARHRLRGARLRRADGDRRRDGRKLAEEWGEVPRAYLGITVPDFPNLFLLFGPNTNGGTGSVVTTIEYSMAHVLAALGQLERPTRAASRCAATPPRRSTASCAPPSPAPSGTPAAGTGTSTRTGTTRTSGRGYGATTAAGPPGSSRTRTR